MDCLYFHQQTRVRQDVERWVSTTLPSLLSLIKQNLDPLHPLESISRVTQTLLQYNSSILTSSATPASASLLSPISILQAMPNRDSNRDSNHHVILSASSISPESAKPARVATMKLASLIANQPAKQYDLELLMATAENNIVTRHFNMDIYTFVLRALVNEGLVYEDVSCCSVMDNDGSNEANNRYCKYAGD